MTTLRFKVFANLYKDSVTLMQIGARLREREGVTQASCVMATPANLAQLADADLLVEARASPSDLLVVVRGEAEACDQALESAEAALQSRGTAHASGDGGGYRAPNTSIALALESEPEARLALISVPGDYAAAEALKALERGLHVMLFSDNVPIDEERQIKTFAHERGLLVMGPDCGTAIVGGVPLGFANVVRRGEIGLVAASGTGLQEVTCHIHHLGGGVSQALGTGGRDLHETIGGITMLQGLAALAADAQTRVIVLISKPPAPAIARRIEAQAAMAGKPVVIHFLGAAPRAMPAGLVAAGSLRHAAELAVALSRGDAVAAEGDALDAPADAALERCIAAMAPTQRSVRALFTGGTFCYEAQLAFIARDLACRSNAAARGAQDFDGRWDGHVLLDLGDDDYTRGRPHPMIDPSIRDAMVRAQGDDAQAAAILFDVVLGYGAHPDPAGSLAQALADAQCRAHAAGRTLALIGHVCGTDDDPQDRTAQLQRLRDAGALVAGSNIEAARWAVSLARRLATR